MKGRPEYDCDACGKTVRSGTGFTGTLFGRARGGHDLLGLWFACSGPCLPRAVLIATDTARLWELEVQPPE